MSKEADCQIEIRLKASQAGWRLFRNNVGAGMLENGNFLRWGLANDSTVLNKQIKSGDLIGLRPVLITDDMVGKTIGQFVSIEVKKTGWIYHGTDREAAQARWIDEINNLGGFALFSTGELE